MRHHQPDDAPLPGGPYSHAVSAAGLVFVSGQRPTSPSDGSIPEDVEGQVRQVLENVSTVLRSAGCTLRDVVKVNVHLADITDFDRLNAVYREFFEPPYPARITVGSTLRGILVEIDVIAAIPGSDGADLGKTAD